MNGIIVIDKPSGWTSHDVVAKLRGALRIKRIGHGGTLDPIATGVLPVFIGRATRAAGFLESSDKEYIAGLRLGIATDTQDITGSSLRICDADISPETLSGVIPRFLGAQKQIPPMYSAVKIGGRKLYELARQGVEIDRPPRDVHIEEIEILGGGGQEFLIRVACSKGTYIRTLCHDIGEALGCGGVMSSLRRTRAGRFCIDDALSLDEVLAAAAAGLIAGRMMPVDTVFSAYPSITLDERDARKCKNGVPCHITGSQDGIFRFYGPDNEFILYGEVKSGAVKVLKSFYIQ